MRQLAGSGAIYFFARFVLESWRDLEPYNFPLILFVGADEKVGGIRSQIFFCQILFGKLAGSGAILFSAEFFLRG